MQVHSNSINPTAGQGPAVGQAADGDNVQKPDSARVAVQQGGHVNEFFAMGKKLETVVPQASSTITFSSGSRSDFDLALKARSPQDNG